MRLPDRVRRLFRVGLVTREITKDVDDELEFHFEESIKNLRSQGFTDEEAQARALAAFGDEPSYRRALKRIGVARMRVRRRREIGDVVLGTLGYTVRGVRRHPGFTASIVVILGLGIGANAVMFGLVDRMMLRPPQHVVDADAVRLVHVRREGSTGPVMTPWMSYPDYEDFLAVNAFADVAAYRMTVEMTVGRGTAASRARVVSVSANFFSLLGVQPALGRFFTDEGSPIEPSATAVLAHEYWERQYGGDPGIVGRQIELAGRDYTVVAIAPAGFTGASLEPVDAWIPIALYFSTGVRRTNRGLSVTYAAVRLAAGTTLDAAEAEATASHRFGRAAEIGADRYDAEAEIVLTPLLPALGPNPPGEARVVRWLAGVSLIVLLIACFNVANLLLVRGMRARREVAVRLSLGAGRGRLVGELVAEGALLAAMGAGAALLAAATLREPVQRLLGPDVAFTDTGLGPRLIGFTLVATLGATLLTGLIAASQASRVDLVDALKDGGQGITRGRSRTRSALLVGQVGLSGVLLVGAGLFVQSLRMAQTVDLGFDSHRIVKVEVQFDGTVERNDQRAIYEHVKERILRLPGVRAAGFDLTGVFGPNLALGVRAGDVDFFPEDPSRGPFVNRVSSGYFEAMGLTVLRGRAFERSDDADDARPVVIVSESLADAVWPGREPLGACMSIRGPNGEEPPIGCSEVVGVVENHHHQGLAEDNPHYMYFLNATNRTLGFPLPGWLTIGTTGDAEPLLDLIRSEANAVSTRIRFVDAHTLSDRAEPQLRPWKLGASVFTAFGFLALVVAALGLYSVLAFEVALRRHELGIRSALGAGMGRLVQLVTSRTMLFVGVGVGVALLVVRAGSGLVEPMLFRVSPTDPMTYTLVAGSLLLTGLAAGALPAWRATRVDPREVLQAD